MSNKVLSLVIFAAGLLITLIATPPIVRFAKKHGITDKPGPRRVNVKEISRFGGPAMFIGFILSMLFAWGRVPHLHYIFIGAGIMFLTGAIDDVKSLNAKIKLLAQIAAACFMFFTGTRLEFINNPFAGGYFYLPVWLSFFITVFWIVGITNTLNLIDGLDGLAAGVTCIASLTFFLVALKTGQKEQVDCAFLAIAMVGVTGGFLRWNFYPAKTIMGDSGAYFLGFMVSIIALKGSFKSTTALTFLLPVFALGIPIFDTSFAIARRLRSGQPVMTAPDKGHLHHRLLAGGWRHRDAVILLYIVTLTLSVGALILNRAYILALYLVAGIMALTGLLIVVGKLKRKPSANG